MRVLHVFKTYLPDSFTGIERVIWEVAEGTSRLGVRNHVFYLSATVPERPLRIDHHWAHPAKRDLDIASTPLSACAVPGFRKLANAVDIVHYHFPWPMMDVLHLAGRIRTPSVVTYHSDIVRQKTLLRLYGPLMHWFLRRMDRIVATSPNYIESSPVLARYRDKTVAVPIGLDPSRWNAPAPARLEEWRRKLPPRFFLFLGELRYYKGLPFLIEAARRTGIPVVVAGGGSLDTDELPENITLTGRVSDDDKGALLALCDAFVFPSYMRSEAFGIALLEAAFAGKALISCEIGTGTTYINRDGETGIAIPPADADALSEAMQTLWNDPDLSRRMGEAARARAYRLFLADDMVQAYHAIYEDVLERRKARQSRR